MGGAASTACIFAGFADKLLKKVHHYFVNILCSTSAPRIVFWNYNFWELHTDPQPQYILYASAWKAGLHKGSGFIHIL